MKVFTGLLRKDWKLSEMFIVRNIIVIFGFWIIFIGLAQYYEEPEFPFYGLGFLIMLHMFYIMSHVLASLTYEGKTQIWLHNPNSMILLLGSKIVIACFSVIFSLLFLLVFNSQPSLQYFNGKVMEWSPFVAIVFKFFLYSLEVIMYSTIAFMISSVFRNSSLAIGISIFLFFTGSTATQVVGMKYEWAKFSPFANTNFESFSNGTPLVPGTTLGFSVTMFILYFVLFHVVSFLVFTKRDITA